MQHMYMHVLVHAHTIIENVRKLISIMCHVHGHFGILSLFKVRSVALIM